MRICDFCGVLNWTQTWDLQIYLLAAKIRRYHQLVTTAGSQSLSRMDNIEKRWTQRNILYIDFSYIDIGTLAFVYFYSFCCYHSALLSYFTMYSLKAFSAIKRFCFVQQSYFIYAFSLCKASHSAKVNTSNY